MNTLLMSYITGYFDVKEYLSGNSLQAARNEWLKLIKEISNKNI